MKHLILLFFIVLAGCNGETGGEPIAETSGNSAEDSSQENTTANTPSSPQANLPAQVDDIQIISKSIEPLSFQSSLKTGGVFTRSGIAGKYFYELSHSGNTSIFKTYLLNLNGKEFINYPEFTFADRVRNVFFNMQSGLYVVLKNSDVYQFKSNTFEKIGQAYGSSVKVKTYKSLSNICIKDRESKDFYFIKDEMVAKTTFSSNDEIQKIFCTESAAFIQTENDIHRLSNDGNETVLSRSHCNDFKLIMRNFEMYFSCKIDNTRNYYSYSNPNSIISLPTKITYEHSNYIVKFDQSDLNQNQDTSFFVWDRRTETEETISLSLTKKAYGLNYLTKVGENYLFTGNKDLYHFDKDFNLLKKQDLPFRARSISDESHIMNNKFHFYDLENYNVSNYFVRGGRYLNELKTSTPNFNLSFQYLHNHNNRFYFKNKDKLYSTDTIDELEITTLSSTKDRVVWKNGKFIAYSFDKNTKKLHLKSDRTSEIVDREISLEKFNHNVYFDEQSLILYNGGEIQFYNITDLSLLGTLTIKHFKKLIPVSSTKLLGIYKDDIFVVDIPSRSVNHIAKLPNENIQISNFHFVDNHLVIKAKDHSLMIFTVTNSQILTML